MNFRRVPAKSTPAVTTMKSRSEPAGNTASSGIQFDEPAVYAAQNPGMHDASSAMSSRASSLHAAIFMARYRFRSGQKTPSDFLRVRLAEIHRNVRQHHHNHFGIRIHHDHRAATVDRPAVMENAITFGIPADAPRNPHARFLAGPQAL